ncbi:MAG: hypothetical protein IT410_03965 [Candidatus Doudnabacteria bacterium]|nr:hypothetical protein [Candidatus Doudnabacteria bacterium]
MSNQKLSLLLICALLFLPNNLSAHTLENVSSIGAVLHINPDDNPVVRQPATLVFSMSDQENLFNAKQCACTLSIKRGEDDLGSLDVSAISLDKLELVYTFPEVGLYTLTLNGIPKDGAIFEPFNLDFDLQVERTEAAVGTDFKTFLLTHGLHIILFGGAFAVVFAIHLRDLYRKRKQSKL